MSKTIIEVKCTDQVLTLTNTPVIASGGMGEVYVRIEFCSMWTSYAKTVLFWRKGVAPVPVVEDEDGDFQMPGEVSGTDGVAYFGVVGYDGDGNRRTSEAISYRIEAGAINEGTELPSPDGDVFDQLMSYYADVKLYVATRVDDVATWAEKSMEYADSAAASAAAAEAQAAAAVASIETIIYPGVVEADLDDGANSIGVTLDSCPPDKMFLTFRAPALYDTTYDEFYLATLRVKYPADDGTETKELFWLRDGYQSKVPDNAIQPRDVVTVLLSRVDSKSVAYVMTPRVTQTTLDEMNRRLYPGIPASTTVDGTMTVALDDAPEDKMILVFTPDEASSQVSKFQLEYETTEDLVQVEYSLVDAKDSPVESYGFYAGDYVLVMLTPADKRATVLNPRVSRDTKNYIQELVDEMGGQESSSGGCEIVTYTGDGTAYRSLVFTTSPKIILVESVTSGNYQVSAVLFRDEAVAKVRVFSNGDYYENIVAVEAAWDKLVLLRFTDYGITPTQLNYTDTKYIATGIM